MKINRVTPILNVSDVPASIAWFEKLGWQRGFTWNDGGGIENGADSNTHGFANFGSVCAEDAEIFLCKDGQGTRNCRVPSSQHDDTGGVWMSWWLPSSRDVDVMHRLTLQLGYDVIRPPVDEPWGVREFHLRHPDGHTFRVSAGIQDD